MAAESIKYVMLTGLLLLVMYWNNIEYKHSEVSGIDDKYEDLGKFSLEKKKCELSHFWSRPPPLKSVKLKNFFFLTH